MLRNNSFTVYLLLIVYIVLEVEMSKKEIKIVCDNAISALPAAILIEFIITMVIIAASLRDSKIYWGEFLVLSLGPLLFFLIITFSQYLVFFIDEKHVRVYRRFFVLFRSNKIEINSIKKVNIRNIEPLYRVEFKLRAINYEYNLGGMSPEIFQDFCKCLENELPSGIISYTVPFFE